METESADQLNDWRQGDFARAVGGFSFATNPEDEFPYSVAEETDGIWGLILITQTCDIVLETAGRHYVSVCPLIEQNEEQAKAIRSGRQPNLIEIEGVPINIFADLGRVMSVSKSLLRTWDRIEGFSSDQGRRNFASALERKFGRFAFPDDFDASIKRLRDRVWSRHDRTGSDVGKIYRSIAEVRFAAIPSWEASSPQIRLLALLEESEKREANIESISAELEAELEKIVLPEGYVWDDPNFIVAEPKDLTGEDILYSDRVDFNFLCR